MLLIVLQIAVLAALLLVTLLPKRKKKNTAKLFRIDRDPERSGLAVGQDGKLVEIDRMKKAS